MHSIDPAFQCALTIAGIGVTLTCDDPAFTVALRERYHAFPLHTSSQLHVHVAVAAAGVHECAPAADVVLDGRVVRHADPNKPSYIDVAAKHGELIVAAPFALEETEYWLRVVYALLAFRAGGLLFHAAGLVRDQRAFLFCGRSGSGKTTVARLSPNDVLLNDDLVVLLPNTDGDWIAHATPFSNPTQVQPTGNTSAPVAAVLRLVQNKKVDLQAVTGALALAELIANVPVVSADPSLGAAVLQRCQRMLSTLPVYYLHFLPDGSFWPAVESTVGV